MVLEYTRPQTDDSPLVYNFEFFTYFSAEDNTYTVINRLIIML